MSKHRDMTTISAEAQSEWFAPFVVTIADREKEYATASGTLIEIGSRVFVATAAHVIKANPQGRLWLVKRRGSCESEGFPSFVDYHRHPKGHPDVGILELDRSVAAGYFGHHQFCTLENIAVLDQAERIAVASWWGRLPNS